MGQGQASPQMATRKITLHDQGAIRRTRGGGGGLEEVLILTIKVEGNDRWPVCVTYGLASIVKEIAHDRPFLIYNENENGTKSLRGVVVCKSRFKLNSRWMDPLTYDPSTRTIINNYSTNVNKTVGG